MIFDMELYGIVIQSGVHTHTDLLSTVSTELRAGHFWSAELSKNIKGKSPPNRAWKERFFFHNETANRKRKTHLGIDRVCLINI